MEFLKDRNRTREMTDTKDRLDLMATESDEIAQKVVDNGNDVPIRLTSTPLGKKRSLSSSRSQNKAKYSTTDEALATMRDMQERKSVRNRYVLFGEQVGMQIRDLPTPYSRRVVRQIINTVLFDAEMGKYDCPPTTSSQPYYPAAHVYSLPPISGVPINTYISELKISSNPTFRPAPFLSPSQISTSTMSPASFPDGPDTTAIAILSIIF